jgi:GNAT superfamily N-acetyltransferase
MTATSNRSGNIAVTRLDVSETRNLNDAAAVAARAFQFDPFFEYLSWRPLLRARGLGIYTKTLLAALGDRGKVYGARRQQQRLIGVAAWIGPGDYPLPIGAQAHQALGALWALWPQPRGLLDGAKYLLEVERVHPKDPHWYLNLLVADPSDQRGGVGTALLTPMLDRIDEQALPAYLETQNPDNLAYYGRFGFEVREELKPVADGPHLWTLWREPRPRSD